MAKIVPSIAFGTFIFPDSAPLALAEIGAPLPPRWIAQALMFRSHAGTSLKMLP